jgi:carboxyl-terminal processing protease
MEFMAHLRNGHSDFGDRWLWNAHGQPVGFLLDPGPNGWTVLQSGIQGLDRGDVVTAIDAKPVDDFISERIRYSAASDERTREAKVFFIGFLWPKSFTLTLKGGRRLTVNRLEPKWKPATGGLPVPTLPEGVVYHRIRSFGESKFENAAIEFVKSNAGAKLIIFDVRGNGGGSTPERLLRAIMDRPYRSWVESTSMHFGLFATYGELFRSGILRDADPRLRGYLEGFSNYFARPYFMSPGAIKQPENPIYKGRIFILQDRACASACEDFVMPLKTSGRATVFGERTYGSSGQPYMHDFGNGMSFRVSTKRMYFPDGTEFEGVGIQPDVEVLSADPDRDQVLEAALKAYAGAAR